MTLSCLDWQVEEVSLLLTATRSVVLVLAVPLVEKYHPMFVRFHSIANLSGLGYAEPNSTLSMMAVKVSVLNMVTMKHFLEGSQVCWRSSAMQTQVREIPD